MPFALAHGITFHVQELGAGPPVVMLHGLLVGSMTTWYFTAAPRVARSHRVLLYDLRGHGKSERAPSGYDVDTMADDLAALADGFSPEPIGLVGHSYGAAVALRFALRHPERVARLALVEAPVPATGLAELEAFVHRRWDEKLEALPETFRDALLKQGRAARRFLDTYRFLARDSSLLDDLRSNREVDEAELGRLRCPVLCLYGTRSSCRPAGEHLARAIPGAELVLVEGGHFLPLEAPQAVIEHVSRFLDG